MESLMESLTRSLTRSPTGSPTGSPYDRFNLMLSEGGESIKTEFERMLADAKGSLERYGCNGNPRNRCAPMKRVVYERLRRRLVDDLGNIDAVGSKFSASLRAAIDELHGAIAIERAVGSEFKIILEQLVEIYLISQITGRLHGEASPPRPRLLQQALLQLCATLKLHPQAASAPLREIIGTGLQLATACADASALGRSISRRTRPD